jgi:hypothetical protein
MVICGFDEEGGDDNSVPEVDINHGFDIEHGLMQSSGVGYMGEECEKLSNASRNSYLNQMY